MIEDPIRQCTKGHTWRLSEGRSRGWKDGKRDLRCPECERTRDAIRCRTPRGRERKRSRSIAYYYRNQDRMKEYLARYFQTEAGKAARARYNQSEKGHASDARYSASLKGRTAQDRALAKQRMIRKPVMKRERPRDPIR